MLRPLRKNILVQPLHRQQSETLQVVSGEKFNLGKIVAVGPKALDVKVGDLIRFGESKNDSHHKFPTFCENGTDYLVMSEMDVCFVQEDQSLSS